MSLLTRRSPFPTLSPFDERDGLDAMFRRMFADATPAGYPWTPSVEVQEDGNRLLLTAELPGMSEDDLTITVENNVLTIAGEKKAERERKGEDERTLVSERFYGAFTRAFTLPPTVDADAVRAEFANGVLSVELPKSPQSKGRVIAVKGATR